jgi:hypothetical protein
VAVGGARASDCAFVYQCLRKADEQSGEEPEMTRVQEKEGVSVAARPVMVVRVQRGHCSTLALALAREDPNGTS